MGKIKEPILFEVWIEWLEIRIVRIHALLLIVFKIGRLSVVNWWKRLIILPLNILMLGIIVIIYRYRLVILLLKLDIIKLGVSTLGNFSYHRIVGSFNWNSPLTLLFIINDNFRLDNPQTRYLGYFGAIGYDLIFFMGFVFAGPDGLQLELGLKSQTERIRSRKTL